MEASLPVTREDRNMVQEGRAEFWYSNGWWLVEAAYTSPDLVKGLVYNYMTVPGGVRRLLAGEPLTTLPKPTSAIRLEAHVVPTPYPRPYENALFVAWLALCPQPDLGEIGPGRLQWCDWEVSTEYRCVEFEVDRRDCEPGGAWVCGLMLRYNETGLDASGKVVRPAPARHRGYLAMEYEVQETVRDGGLVRPQSAVLRRFVPRLGARKADELRVVLEAWVRVVRWERWHQGTPSWRLRPAEVVARDWRFWRTRGEDPLIYPVWDDIWEPVSSPRLQEMAGFLPVKRVPGTPAYRRWVVILALAAMSGAGLWYLVRTSRNRPGCS